MLMYYYISLILTRGGERNQYFLVDKNYLVCLPYMCSGSEWQEHDSSVTNSHPWDRNYFSLISHMISIIFVFVSELKYRCFICYPLPVHISFEGADEGILFNSGFHIPKPVLYTSPGRFVWRNLGMIRRPKGKGVVGMSGFSGSGFRVRGSRARQACASRPGRVALSLLNLLRRHIYVCTLHIIDRLGVGY
jgi:hypothetical protein